MLVGDVQCGKTAMLQVLAKDCYPEVRDLCTTLGLQLFSDVLWNRKKYHQIYFTGHVYIIYYFSLRENKYSYDTMKTWSLTFF